MDSEVKPASEACSSQSRRSRRSGRVPGAFRDPVSASKSTSVDDPRRVPNWKLNPPWESVWVSVCGRPLQTVWMETDSVSTLPSSITTLPVRKIVVGVTSGVITRGRDGVFTPRPPPPEPGCPEAGREEIDNRQATTRRAFITHPRLELCRDCTTVPAARLSTNCLPGEVAFPRGKALRHRRKWEPRLTPTRHPLWLEQSRRRHPGRIHVGALRPRDWSERELAAPECYWIRDGVCVRARPGCESGTSPCGTFVRKRRRS